MRLRDDDALERARSRGYCEWPGCTFAGRTDPAHISTRGHGAPDCDENLVSLCRLHHTLQESMGRRGKQIMRQIVAQRIAKAKLQYSSQIKA